MIAGYSDGKCSSWLSERWKRQDVKMLRWKLKRGIETCVLIQNDSKKIKIARARLYEGDRVVGREWGTERKDGEDVRCEDVTQTLLHTDADRRFYIQTLLRRTVFTHRRLYIHRRLYTQKFFHTHTFLRTNAFTHRHLLRTHTHTCSDVLSNCDVECNGRAKTPTTKKHDEMTLGIYIYMGV